MKKRILSLLLVLMLSLTFAVPALAAGAPYPLHQVPVPIDWTEYRTSEAFGLTADDGLLVPGYELGTTGTAFWHFINPDKLGGYADITFLMPDGETHTFYNVTSYKNDQHFGVVTLQTWQLLSAAYYPETDPGNTLFNLSHTAGILYGELNVSASVVKQHAEVTWQRYYERDVQNFYERDVQDFYIRDVQDFYVRDVQDFYQRDVFDRYVPVFEKKVSNANFSTLTSRLADNVGGKFGNGMVWLEIDGAKAMSEGYTFGIAQSNPGNTGIGYDYKVKIEGIVLTVSFDERFIGTSVTAKVYTAAPKKHDNSRHVALGPGGSISVNLPAGYGSKVYLYVHFEGGISWYTMGNYEFVEWRYKDTITSDYELKRTETGEYELVRTETGDYEFERTVYGNYELVNTVRGQYKLIKTEEVSRQTVVDQYNALFDLVVRDAANVEVYRGVLGNNGSVTIPLLLPGTYTVTLSGADIGTVTKTATVVALQTATVIFDGITITGEQVDIYLDGIYSDNQLEDVKTDNKLGDQFSDNKLEDQFSDNKLDDVYLEDNILPDVKLGNETDPYNEHAIRLN